MSSAPSASASRLHAGDSASRGVSGSRATWAAKPLSPPTSGVRSCTATARQAANGPRSRGSRPQRLALVEPARGEGADAIGDEAGPVDAGHLAASSATVGRAAAALAGLAAPSFSAATVAGRSPRGAAASAAARSASVIEPAAIWSRYQLPRHGDGRAGDAAEPRRRLSPAVRASARGRGSRRRWRRAAKPGGWPARRRRRRRAGYRCEAGSCRCACSWLFLRAVWRLVAQEAVAHRPAAKQPVDDGVGVEAVRQVHAQARRRRVDRPRAGTCACATATPAKADDGEHDQRPFERTGWSGAGSAPAVMASAAACRAK